MVLTLTMSHHITLIDRLYIEKGRLVEPDRRPDSSEPVSASPDFRDGSPKIHFIRRLAEIEESEH
jgi:hypothetical protein